MKRLLVISAWLLSASITLISTFLLYQTVILNSSFDLALNQKAISFGQSKNAVTAYAAVPASVAGIKGNVLGADARPVTIDAYFKQYNSPLQGLGEFIVITADKFQIDPYLIAAIAQQESNLCKIIPDDSHNCWGWGVHSEGTLKFESYQHAIEAVIRGLKEEYIDKGYDTPEKIMAKYTPLSSGSWSAGVSQFMLDLESGNF